MYEKYERLPNQADPTEFDPLRTSFIRAIADTDKDYEPIQIAFTETTLQVGQLLYERARYRELYATALEKAGHRYNAQALRKEISVMPSPAYPAGGEQ